MTRSHSFCIVTGILSADDNTVHNNSELFTLCSVFIFRVIGNSSSFFDDGYLLNYNYHTHQIYTKELSSLLFYVYGVFQHISFFVSWQNAQRAFLKKDIFDPETFYPKIL